MRLLLYVVYFFCESGLWVYFGLGDELYSCFFLLEMKASVMGFHFIGVECNRLEGKSRCDLGDD